MRLMEVATMDDGETVTTGDDETSGDGGEWTGTRGEPCEGCGSPKQTKVSPYCVACALEAGPEDEEGGDGS